MKKIYLLFSLLLISLGAQAQFSVVTSMGELEDGDTLVFHSTAETSDAYLDYYIVNTSSQAINMRIKAIEFENTDGSGMEVCLGFCYYGIIEGQTIPVNDYVTIAPGDTSSASGVPLHFWSYYEGNGNEIISYYFEFQQLNNAGVVTNTLGFVYAYVPNGLAVETPKKDFDVQIMSTMIRNGRLSIKTQKPVEVQVYNLLGQEVKTAKISGGVHSINVADLSSQIYLVRFHNKQGQTKTQKIVIE